LTMQIHLKLNGRNATVSVEARETLLDTLRDRLALTGAKKGCDEAVCGACAVLFNGEPICSCNILTVEADGAEITTIEGVAGDARSYSMLDQLQRAFIDEDAMQCAFCTSGQIISAKAFIQKFSEKKTKNRGQEEFQTVDELRNEIKEALSGNLCRCGCYNNIADAVMKVAAAAGATTAKLSEGLE